MKPFNKKTCAIIVAAFLSLTLTACGSDRDIKENKLTLDQINKIKNGLTGEERSLIERFQIAKAMGLEETKGDFSYNEMMSIVKKNTK